MHLVLWRLVLSLTHRPQQPVRSALFFFLQQTLKTAGSSNNTTTAGRILVIGSCKLCPGVFSLRSELLSKPRCRCINRSELWSWRRFHAFICQKNSSISKQNTIKLQLKSTKMAADLWHINQHLIWPVRSFKARHVTCNSQSGFVSFLFFRYYFCCDVPFFNLCAVYGATLSDQATESSACILRTGGA